MFKKILTITITLLLPQAVHAAVGCTLNDPDRDVKRLFPKATNYKTEFISIKDFNDPNLKLIIEEKLGDKFEPVYEANDVPYAYYTILSKKELIGYVHGVNQKGRFGGMQLILATDPNGVILDFYYQKLTSPESRKFRDKKFTKQFVGLSLKDFYTKELRKEIKNPGKKLSVDYLATFRGLKKNLILHDQFKLANRYDKIYFKQKLKEQQEQQKEKENVNPNEK